MTERWSVVGDEDDPATEGHIQYMRTVQAGQEREQWAWAGVENWEGDVYGTPLLGGEQAIVVTCRAEDRAALLAWLCGRLNVWEG